MIWTIARIVSIIAPARLELSDTTVCASVDPNGMQCLKRVQELVAVGNFQDASVLVEQLYQSASGYNGISEDYEFAVCGIGEVLDQMGGDFYSGIQTLNVFRDWHYQYSDNSLAAAFYGLSLIYVADCLQLGKFPDVELPIKKAIHFVKLAEQHFSDAGAKHADHWFWRQTLFYGKASRGRNVDEVWSLFLSALELQPSSGNLFTFMVTFLVATSEEIERDIGRLLQVALEHENFDVGAMLANWVIAKSIEAGETPSRLRGLLRDDQARDIALVLEGPENAAIDAANFHFLCGNWNDFLRVAKGICGDEIDKWYHPRSLELCITYAELKLRFSRHHR